MICTDKFTFIHLHKTAGQTLNDIIYNSLPCAKAIGYHYPISKLPVQYKDVPIVGIIRNPWDWYLSWFTFNSVGGIKNPLFNIVSNGKQADFKTTITNLLNYPDDSGVSSRYRKSHGLLMPDDFNQEQGAGFTNACVLNMQSNSKGYYSLLVERMFGTDYARQKIIFFEGLVENFDKLMHELGVAEAATMTSLLRSAKRRNSSNHSHYSHYYDDELRDLVCVKDASLIQRYGYEFENRSTSSPIIDIGGGQLHPKVFSTQQNYYRIGSIDNLEPLLEKVAQLTEQDWSISDRQTVFDIHQKTKSIKIFFDDMSHTIPEKTEFHSRFESVLEPVLAQLEKAFGEDGTFIRIILARLEAGAQIEHHVDKGYSLLNSNRVHIPLITNKDVAFYVGGETKNLQAGDIWEINNATVHAVHNKSKHHRVHLIIDWTPSHTLLREKKAYRMDLPIFYKPQLRI
ncbi:MAG: hypothetical protein ACI9WC_000818 [Arenicella sp.]|jgi:hypothetical protein